MTMHGAASRWRWHLKAGLAAVINAIGRHGTPLRVNGGYRPLVVGYHRVVTDFDASCRHDMSSMLISAAMFERHMEFLGRHFAFVSVDEVGEAVRARRPFERPVVAVTFDDGYADVYQNAVPILKRYGIPAAVFVVTDLVGRSAWQIHDKLFHLVEKGFSVWTNPRRSLHAALVDLDLPAGEILADHAATRSPLQTVSALLPSLSHDDVTRLMGLLECHLGNGFVNVPRSMTWPMLQRMIRDGFTVGSHTRSHVSLPKESADVASDQLHGSKRVLEERLGHRIDHFAYPGGQFTPSVVEALAATGYRYAYTACPHHDTRHPELTIERLLLWQGSSIDGDGEFSEAILACQARDLWPPARVCSRAHV